MTVQECRSSGLPVRRRCREKGITAATYYRWERELLSVSDNADVEESTVTFAELPALERLYRNVSEGSATLQVGVYPLSGFTFPLILMGQTLPLCIFPLLFVQRHRFYAVDIKSWSPSVQRKNSRMSHQLIREFFFQFRIQTDFPSAWMPASVHPTQKLSDTLLVSFQTVTDTNRSPTGLSLSVRDPASVTAL